MARRTRGGHDICKIELSARERKREWNVYDTSYLWKRRSSLYTYYTLYLWKRSSSLYTYPFYNGALSKNPLLAVVSPSKPPLVTEIIVKLPSHIQLESLNTYHYASNTARKPLQFLWQGPHISFPGPDAHHEEPTMPSEVG